VSRSSEIEELCGGGGGGGGEATVDGVLVTLPDPSVLEALETCDKNGIPVVAFNAGIDLAKSAGYLFC
jgi:ABC-type sugar transport system substrate-binding protein